MCPKEILEFILRKENLSYPKLAKKMEISRTQPLYDIRDGKIKAISANYANRIIKAFPESGYTFGFIITGDESLINSDESKKEGEMKKQSSEIVSEDNIKIDINMDSKDVVIKALTEKIQRLESENAELRRKYEPSEERPSA